MVLFVTQSFAPRPGTLPLCSPAIWYFFTGAADPSLLQGTRGLARPSSAQQAPTANCSQQRLLLCENSSKHTPVFFRIQRGGGRWRLGFCTTCQRPRVTTARCRVRFARFARPGLLLQRPHHHRASRIPIPDRAGPLRSAVGVSGRPSHRVSLQTWRQNFRSLVSGRQDVSPSNRLLQPEAPRTPPADR